MFANDVLTSQKRCQWGQLLWRLSSVRSYSVETGKYVLNLCACECVCMKCTYICACVCMCVCNAHIHVFVSVCVSAHESACVPGWWAVRHGIVGSPASQLWRLAWSCGQLFLEMPMSSFHDGLDHLTQVDKNRTHGWAYGYLMEILGHSSGDWKIPKVN